MSVWDNLGLALLALIIYGYNVAMFFSRGNGVLPQGQFCNQPLWLKILATVFTPVTLAVFAVMYVVLLVCLLGILCKYVFGGDAWREYRLHRAAQHEWDSLTSHERYRYGSFCSFRDNYMAARRA